MKKGREALRSLDPSNLMLMLDRRNIRQVKFTTHLSPAVKQTASAALITHSTVSRAVTEYRIQALSDPTDNLAGNKTLMESGYTGSLSTANPRLPGKGGRYV